MKHIEDETTLDGVQVVRFVQLYDANNLHGYKPVVRVYRGSGCSSYVGMVLDMAVQDVSLGNGCVDKGTVVHEFMHALGTLFHSFHSAKPLISGLLVSKGFYHEQARPDRDHYVTVFYENVQEGLLSYFSFSFE